MVASHASCAFSFGASERLGGGVGRRLPVNIRTWAGAGAGVRQSQGSRLEKWVPLQTQALGDSACAPLPSPQNKTTVKKPEQMPRKGVPWPFLAPQKRAGFKQGGLGQPPPTSGAEGGDGGAENREKIGVKRPGDRRGAWSSCPYLPQGLGEQSRRWPILPGPAAPQKRPQSFRLFLMMTSVTASNTNCTFLVSVAHVKCV